MLAAVSICLGALMGIAVGAVGARKGPAASWRPSRTWCLAIIGLTVFGVIYEVWFVFGHARYDELMRTDPVPLAFFFVWTLALAGAGTWAWRQSAHAERQ